YLMPEKAIKTGHKKAFSGIRYTTQAIKIEHATGLLETQGISALERYWAKLRADKKAGPILRDPDISQAMARSRALAEAGCKHPKMSAICSVVDRTLAENPQARIIIFASYRDTVKEIVGVLSSLEQARPIILMGQRDGLSQKEQIEVIKRFGEGDCNILVTTSIGEEGLSIESADIAVFYEAVPSEIRQIQRRGRVGRVRIGKIIILITKNTRDEAYYWAARQKERRMHKTLKGMANQEALQNP
ncbi:MAG: helicase-related protein, partial [Candidatus Aenigmatarchaeota archaeon]